MKKSFYYKIWLEKNIKTNHLNLLISNIIGMNKSDFFFCEEIEEKYHNKIIDSIGRLEKWEPIEYIIKKAEFYSLDFYVDNRVLIPRNDTEVMIDKIIDEINENPGYFDYIDIWSWSWCISISINKNTSKIKNSYSIDISPKTLEVTKINLKIHSLENKIKILESSLTSDIDKLKLENNLIISANLPYIKDNDFENMSKETVEYEPSLALYWWKETGFELYEKLINQLELFKKNYKKEIILFIEIGFDQMEYSKKYLDKKWKEYSFYKDNSGIERTIKIVI